MSTVVDINSPPDTNGKALKKLRDAAVQAHTEIKTIRQWDRMKRMYMGDFYSEIEMPEWKSRKGNPALWEVIQRFVPVLTARQPKFTPKPRGAEDDVMAKMLAFGVDYEWERQAMKRKSAVFSKTGLMLGNSFLYTGVHPGLRSDDLYTKVLTPYDVFPDPMCTGMDDMAYCWFKFTVTKRQLAAMLGPYGKKIFKDLKGGTDSGDENKFRVVAGQRTIEAQMGQIGTRAQSLAGTLSDTEIIGPQSRYLYGQEMHYTVWECWLPEANDSEVVERVDDEEIVLPIKGQGRRVLLIEDKYFPELDTENPFRHGQIPLSVMTVDDFPTEFWAQSYLLPGADQAELLADLTNQIHNWIRMGMNSGWLIPLQADVKPGTVYQFPGIQITYNASNPSYKPEQIQTPDIPSGLFVHRANMKRELDDAYGLSSIGRGNVDGGITHASGTTVQALQAPMSDRMSVIIDNFEEPIGRWGYQTLCNLAQFWTEEKWRRVLPIEYEGMPLPWDDPRYFGEDYDGFMPDIKMEAGSSLPEDKQGKAAMAFNLNSNGAFGEPGGALSARELLHAAEWPGAEEIVQHVAMEQEARNAAAQEPQGPDFGGGQNKALGGKRSPESEMSVKQTGQEVRG